MLMREETGVKRGTTTPILSFNAASDCVLFFGSQKAPLKFDAFSLLII